MKVLYSNKYFLFLVFFFRKGVIHHYLDINLSFSKSNASICIMCIDALYYFSFFPSTQDVFFPSVIVCNINQIRKSLLRGLGLKSYDDIDLLYRQFYTGMDRNLTTKELDTILSLATSEVNLNKYLDFNSISCQYFKQNIPNLYFHVYILLR